MPFEDSSPERRNLIVTSLGFIAFSFAGGEFNDGTVQLEVINATFKHTETLTALVWVIFAWFIYRYWLAHRGKFKNDFRQELRQYAHSKYLTEYVNENENQNLISDNEDGYRAFDAWWQNATIKLEVQYTGKVSRSADGRISSYEHPKTPKPIKHVCLQGFKGWTAGLLVTIECMFNKPSFSGYIVPYILAFIAILGGVFRLTF